MGAGSGRRRRAVDDLDTLMAAVPEALVVVDRHGVIVQANERSAALLGYRRDALVGQAVEVLLPDELREAHRRHRAQYAANRVSRPMASGLALRARRQDGTLIPVDVALGPFETEAGPMVLAALHDVSRSRQDERLFRRFLEAAPDAVVVVDGAGRIIVVNKQVETMFGYERAEILGRPIEALVPGRYAGMHEAFRSSYLADPRPRPIGVAGGLFGLRRDGTEFPVEISLAPLETEDGGLLVIATVRDVTERQRVAAAMQEAEERRWVQEQASRAKDEFLATVSHELRTPLSSILGYVELMADHGGLDPQSRSFLTVIARNAEREIRLVDDLLTVVSVEERGLAVRLIPIDLATVACDAVEEQGPVAAARGVDLTLDTPLVPVVIDGDSARLAQALTNLLSNALKFTPEGGYVHVAVSIEGAVARIDVVDTGMGIGNADPGHLFERLVRGENAVAHEIPGAGLGLPIALAIVEAHHGTIEVVESSETGTRFRMEFPLAEHRVITPEDLAEQPPSGEPGS